MSPKSIQKAGKAIAPVQHVCEIFEQQTAPYMHSDLHATPQFGKDFRTVLSVLTSEQVFSEVKGIIYLTAISPLYLRNIQSRILRKTSRRVSNNYIIHNYTSKTSKCYRLHMIQSHSASHTSQQEQPLILNPHSEKSSNNNLRLQRRVFDSYNKDLAVAFLAHFPDRV